MRRFLSLVLAGFLAGFFWSAQAGPPQGMIQKMSPMHMMCLQADVNPNHFATLMGRLIEDYGVWISMTFSADVEKTKRVAIIENSRTNMVGVLINTDHETCILVSGQDRKVFVMPDGHPVGKLNQSKDEGV